MGDIAGSEATHDENEGHTKEAKRCRALGREERYVVRRWWQRLTLSEYEARQRQLSRPWPRGVRAVLRRCESPDAAVLTEGFRKLWQMLQTEASQEGQPPRLQRDMYAWACVAIVLAELRKEMPGETLGSRFGKQKEKTGSPLVSELRFQHLQQSQSADELVRRLRRGLALVGNEGISAVNLADDILLWCRENGAQEPLRARRVEDRLAFRWANDYFTTRSRYLAND